MINRRDQAGSGEGEGFLGFSRRAERWRPVLLIPLAIQAFRALPSTPPGDLGVRAGRLADCPGTPNCVSSQSVTPAEKVAPIPFRETADEATRRIKAALATLPRTVVVGGGPGYVRAEATSLVLGFVDDIEFVADPDSGVIHVRSASRLGKSDLGVNRDRVERFRRAFATPGGG